MTTVANLINIFMILNDDYRVVIYATYDSRVFIRLTTLANLINIFTIVNYDC